MSPVFPVVIKSLPYHAHNFRECHNVVGEICNFRHERAGWTPWIIWCSFPYFDFCFRIIVDYIFHLSTQRGGRHVGCFLWQEAVRKDDRNTEYSYIYIYFLVYRANIPSKSEDCQEKNQSRLPSIMETRHSGHLRFIPRPLPGGLRCPDLLSSSMQSWHCECTRDPSDSCPSGAAALRVEDGSRQ